MMLEDREKLAAICRSIDELVDRVGKLSGGLGTNVLAPIQRLEQVAANHHVGLHELHNDLGKLNRKTDDLTMRHEQQLSSLFVVSREIKYNIEGMLRTGHGQSVVPPGIPPMSPVPGMNDPSKMNPGDIIA